MQLFATIPTQSSKQALMYLKFTSTIDNIKMKHFPIFNRKILIILAVALLAIGIPSLVTIYQQSQETRGYAATPNNRI